MQFARESLPSGSYSILYALAKVEADVIWKMHQSVVGARTLYICDAELIRGTCRLWGPLSSICIFQFICFPTLEVCNPVIGLIGLLRKRLVFT